MELTRVINQTGGGFTRSSALSNPKLWENEKMLNHVVTRRTHTYELPTSGLVGSPGQFVK